MVEVIRRNGLLVLKIGSGTDGGPFGRKWAKLASATAIPKVLFQLSGPIGISSEKSAVDVCGCSAGTRPWRLNCRRMANAKRKLLTVGLVPAFDLMVLLEHFL